MYRSHTCGSLRISDIGKRVTLSGWVQISRDLGGLTFVDLRDRYGITQLVFNMETRPELREQASKLGREFVIQVEGTVLERTSKNPNRPTGDIEIDVDQIRILNVSKVPPFTIENESDGGDDLRMKYRYLDLRREPLQKNILFRSKLTLETRKYLDSQGFAEIETPFLIKSTPEGARDFVVPSRLNPGEFYTVKPAQRGLFLRTGRPQALRVMIGDQRVPQLGANDATVSGIGLDAQSLVQRLNGQTPAGPTPGTTCRRRPSGLSST